MKPIEQILDGVTWQPIERTDFTDDGLPYATHSGVMDLFGVKLKVYRLSTGEAVIDADDLHEFFGLKTVEGKL